MTSSSTRRVLAAIVAAASLAIPAAASAMPYSPPSTTSSDAAQSSADAGTRGDPKASYPYGGRGDNPLDHPGMSRAPSYDGPTTIEVVRPERTIVRDVDEALPLILSGTALALVLAGLGFALMRMRLVPRPGRSN
jgi:hypothetical protein